VIDARARMMKERLVLEQNRELLQVPSASVGAVCMCEAWQGALQYSDAKVANRNARVRHGATESGP
jgi:hypothetical protein